jgi:hypothetical protein
MKYNIYIESWCNQTNKTKIFHKIYNYTSDELFIEWINKTLNISISEEKNIIINNGYELKKEILDNKYEYWRYFIEKYIEISFYNYIVSCYFNEYYDILSKYNAKEFMHLYMKDHYLIDNEKLSDIFCELKDEVKFDYYVTIENFEQNEIDLGDTDFMCAILF